MSAQDFYLGTMIGGTIGLLGIAFLVAYAMFGLRPKLAHLAADVKFIRTINAMYQDSLRSTSAEASPAAPEPVAETDEIAQLKKRAKQLAADNERLSYGMAALFGAHPAPPTYSEVAAAAHDAAVRQLQLAVTAVIEPAKK